MKRSICILLPVLFLSACGAPADVSDSESADSLEEGEGVLAGPTEVRSSPDSDVVFTGDEAIGEDPDTANGESTNKNGTGISYHGGPVMTAPVVYYIWYGDFASSTKKILRTFARNIGGSPYFALNTLYHNGDDVHVTNHVTFGGETSFEYYRGHVIDDGDVRGIVRDTIDFHRLPLSVRALYVVLTARDVGMKGFCTEYCGWHTFKKMHDVNVKYAFIGNPGHCAHWYTCEPQHESPNDNPIADAMASVIAHELEEATTDPKLDAWFDDHGAENADKCAWKFPRAHTLANGSRANVSLGDREFLIQANWLNEPGGGCRMRLP